MVERETQEVERHFFAEEGIEITTMLDNVEGFCNMVTVSSNEGRMQTFTFYGKITSIEKVKGGELIVATNKAKVIITPGYGIRKFLKGAKIKCKRDGSFEIKRKKHKRVQEIIYKPSTDNII